jgi:Bacteriocin-protection, YdeI or OmpD-Associated
MEALLKKAGIKPDAHICIENDEIQMKDFFESQSLNVVTLKSNSITHLFYFVKTKSELEKGFSKVMNALNENTKLFVCFPKGKSSIQTDLSRDKGWEVVMLNVNMRWVTLIAVDDNWSAFVVRLKTEKEKKTIPGLMKEYNRDETYFDATKKEVYPPDFFLKLLKKDKVAYNFFNALAYSHKREYVGYILNAKKEETRIARAQKMVQRLADQKKNLTVA